MIRPIDARHDAIDSPGRAADTRSGERELRLFLTRRRREILAPMQALHDIVADILSAPVGLGESILADLDTVRSYAEGFIALVTTSMDPAASGTDSASRALNHDARNFLTVIAGYADEIREADAKEYGGAHAAEFELILSLGRHTLALVDSTVGQLRSDGGVSASDDVRAYLERGGEPTPCEAGAPSAEPGLVLVVEDQEKIRELLCQLLLRQGHQVAVARDGQEALAVLASRPFELVITDIEMPHVSGFELLDRVKGDDRFRDIPVIVVSGHGELDGICRCIKSGAEDYLPKPFNHVLLKARVDACLEKKRLRDRNEQQRRRYDELLHSILPAAIVAELSENDCVRPRRRERVAVLFADIVGFTPFCNRLHDRPEIVVDYLRKVFEDWECIVRDENLLKIKTIGDAFMAAGGLLIDAENPVLDCVRCGVRMIRAARALVDGDGIPLGWDLRVGIHIGPVVSGLLGRRQSLLDLWGDTVNIAARLESHGEPGHVNLSEAAWGCVAGHVRGEVRSLRKLKGTANETAVIHLSPETICFAHGPDLAVPTRTTSPHRAGDRVPDGYCN